MSELKFYAYAIIYPCPTHSSCFGLSLFHENAGNASSVQVIRYEWAATKPQHVQLHPCSFHRGKKTGENRGYSAEQKVNLTTGVSRHLQCFKPIWWTYYKYGYKYYKTGGQDRQLGEESGHSLAMSIPKLRKLVPMGSLSNWIFYLEYFITCSSKNNEILKSISFVNIVLLK